MNKQSNHPKKFLLIFGIIAVFFIGYTLLVKSVNTVSDSSSQESANRLPIESIKEEKNFEDIYVEPLPKIQEEVQKTFSQRDPISVNDWSITVHTAEIQHGNTLNEYDLAVVSLKLKNIGLESFSLPYDENTFVLQNNEGARYVTEGEKTNIPHDPINPGITKTVWLVYEIPTSPHTKPEVAPNLYQEIITMPSGKTFSIGLDKMVDAVYLEKMFDQKMRENMRQH